MLLPEDWENFFTWQSDAFINILRARFSVRKDAFVRQSSMEKQFTL
jgi:hypothetical protein